MRISGRLSGCSVLGGAQPPLAGMSCRPSWRRTARSGSAWSFAPEAGPGSGSGIGRAREHLALARFRQSLSKSGQVLIYGGDYEYQAGKALFDEGMLYPFSFQVSNGIPERATRFSLNLP